MILNNNIDDFIYIRNVQVPSDVKQYVIPLSDTCKLCSEKNLVDRIQYMLTMVTPGAHRDRLTALISRPTYSGVETFHTLKWPFELRFDTVYYCPPSSLLLVGWMIDPFNRVAKISIVREGLTRIINHLQWLPVDRADVVDAFADRYEIASTGCGFVTYVSEIFRPGDDVYLQVDFIDGSIAFNPIRPTLRTGIKAIKDVLSGLTFQPGSLTSAFDHILGPAMSQMNAYRLEGNLGVNVVQFGDAPIDTRCAIVIPLYGRIDFLEYQLARFVTHLGNEDDVIYVLDDPSLKMEAIALARSCYAKFNIAFKLMLLDRNIGFGPASNIGIRHSASQYVCLLNSDVFPVTELWLTQMLETLDRDPAIGIVGPVLIYEDESLQHRGCTLKAMAEFDNWVFPMHPGKGLRPQSIQRQFDFDMITGACMVTSRSLLHDVGLFDEGYIIGDFEDADLCFKIKEQGKTCVVDQSVTLYHLERQSQALESGSWRRNVTLYNAWLFQKRWNPSFQSRPEAASSLIVKG